YHCTHYLNDTDRPALYPYLTGQQPGLKRPKNSPPHLYHLHCSQRPPLPLVIKGPRVASPHAQPTLPLLLHHTPLPPRPTPPRPPAPSTTPCPPRRLVQLPPRLPPAARPLPHPRRRPLHGRLPPHGPPPQPPSPLLRRHLPQPQSHPRSPRSPRSPPQNGRRS